MPDPTPHPASAGFAATLTRLDGDVSALAGLLAEMQQAQTDAFTDIETRHSAQVERVTALSNALADTRRELRETKRRLTEAEDALRDLSGDATPAAPESPEELDRRIVALLDSAPHVKLSGVSVSESIDAENKRVCDRLASLAQRGRIRRLEQPGRNPLYYSRKKAQP